MQEKFGDFLKKSISTRKTIWIFVLSCLALLLCLIFSYFYLNSIQPLRDWFTAPRGYHQGPEFYTEGTYKEFEHGNYFSQILSELDYVSKGKIIDFYHVENEALDNPVQGKKWDIFSLDIQLTPAQYADQSKIVAKENQYYTYISDYDIYISGYGSDHLELTMMCDEDNIIRIVYLPDFENAAQKVETDTLPYFGLVNGLSALEFWSTGQGGTQD